MTGKEHTAELKQGEICSQTLRETTTRSIPLPTGTLYMKVFETACTHGLSCHKQFQAHSALYFYIFMTWFLGKGGNQSHSRNQTQESTLVHILLCKEH